MGGRDGGADDEADVDGVDACALDGLTRSLHGEERGVLTLRSAVALLDARPRGNPIIRRLDHLFEVGVRQDTLRVGATRAEYCRSDFCHQPACFLRICPHIPQSRGPPKRPETPALRTSRVVFVFNLFNRAATLIPASLAARPTRARLSRRCRARYAPAPPPRETLC